MSNFDEQHEKMKNGLAKELGSKGGKNKAGSKHLSTIIRELADDIDWDKTTLKNKDELKAKYGKNGFKAVAYVALTKAMTGDTKAMDWLAKYGYGTKIDITSGDEPLQKIIVEFRDSGSPKDKRNSDTSSKGV